jgi:D-apionolactonase
MAITSRVETAAGPNELPCGEPLPDRVPLRAGPLSLVLEGGDLREVRIAGHEVLQRVYGALRDRDWRTIPAHLSNLAVDRRSDGFRVRYDVEHLDGEIDFAWTADIVGTADGTISFDFRGQARTTFTRNRIGLCVLHPLRECVGQPVTALDSVGRERRLHFPTDVEVAQPIPGFTDLRGLTWRIGPELDADLRFEGDLFETEDQRNWIDASFKTFSTPLALPRPVVVAAGTAIDQRVTLSLRAGRRSRHESHPDTPIEVGRAISVPGAIPRTGVSLGPEPASEENIRLLAMLGLSHVRATIDLQGEWRAAAAQALQASRDLGCRLELQLELGGRCDATLQELARMLPARTLACILPFPRGGSVTTQPVLDAVREHLLPLLPHASPLGSGSCADLYQMHLERPPIADVTVWGMQPQAHATDVTSIAETPIAAGHQVASVRRRRPGPVAVSLRFSASGCDPRMMTSFAAGWTLATLIELMRQGTESVTAFEAIARYGVITPSSTASPVFHVLADLGDRRHSEIVQVDETANVYLVRLRGDGADTVLAANLSRAPATLGWPDGFIAESARVLDGDSSAFASTRPEDFRTALRRVSESGLRLPPFSTARIDGRF